MDQFIKDAKNGNDAEITIIRHYGKRSLDYERWKEYTDISKIELPQGKVIYHLKARHDEQTGDRWIDVISNYDSFKQSDDLAVQIIDSQQCGYIRNHEETGSYMLTECFHAWEYALF